MAILVGQTIGHYLILQRIKKSGWDILYKAFDTQLDRIVALEIILPDQKHSEKLLLALEKYVEQLQPLSHPGIARVLECGQMDGVDYLAYDIYPRNVLSRRSQRPMDVSMASKLLLPIAEALTYAHSLGIIHGNLRLESIIFDKDGKTAIYGVGLIKILLEEISAFSPSTVVGLGPMDFLSPEQIRGNGLDERSDIFAFGRIYFGLISDRRLYPGNPTIDPIIEQVKGPIKKRRIDPELSSIVEKIILHCLEPSPNKRFRNMQHVAILLKMVADRRPMKKRYLRKAPKYPPPKQISGLAISMIVLIVMVFSVGAGAWYLRGLWLVKPISVVAELPTPQPTSTRTLTRVPTSTRIPTFTRTPYITNTQTPIPLPQESEKLPVIFGHPLPSISNDISLNTLREIVPLARWGIGKLNQINWSPDDKFLAFSTSVGVYIFSAETFNFEVHLDTGDWTNTAIFSPDGQLLVVGSRDGLIQIWDTSTWKQSATLSGHIQSVTTLSFSPDSKLFASGGADNQVIIWDAIEKKQIFSLKNHVKPITGIAFSPDGSQLASVSEDLTLKLWNSLDGSIIMNLSNPTPLLGVAFSPNGKHVAVGCEDALVHVWDIQTGQPLPAYQGRITSKISSVVYSPNGSFIAVGEINGTVTVWETDSYRIKWSAKNEQFSRIMGTGYVYSNSLDFSKDGNLLASGIWDDHVMIWDTATGAVVRSLDRYGEINTKIIFSQNSKILITQNANGKVKIWDSSTGTFTHVIDGYIVPGQLFSSDNGLLALKINAGEARVYDVAAGTIIYRLIGHKDIRSISISNDMKYVTIRDGKDLKVWALNSGLEVAVQFNYRHGCTMVYDLNQEFIASSSEINQILYKEDESTCTLTSPSWVKSSFVLPESRLVVQGGTSIIKVFDFPESIKYDLGGFTGYDAVSVALLDDGSILAGGISDKTIRLWDLSKKAEVLTLVGHDSPATSLAFSPDQKILVSTSMDGTIRVWGVH